MSAGSVIVCGVVIDRETGHNIHVDITITDPNIANQIRNRTLKDIALDVTGPTPEEI